ncbi:MAG: amino acid ABC transporter ATP-binding protein [Clostridia bacterium]|nr:amino acid ABC transporter ATP-binding protein [Clostridia bacterium]
MLEVKNLKKSFGAVDVLRGVDFSLEKGEVLAIIGPSGGGKTTLLRCLNFLETPDEGEIWVGGQKIFDAAEHSDLSEAEIRANRLRFGLVFQQFNLFPQYTAKQNITLAMQLQAKERPDYKADRRVILEEIDQQANALLSRVGLLEKADNYPHMLSGGQQQRVAIARALALDPELTGEVLKVIRGLKSSDSTMIVVTHEIQFARHVADKVMFIDEGVIAEYGPSAEVIENPKNERTRAFLNKFEK